MDHAVEAACHAIEERHWWFQGRRHCIVSIVKKLKLPLDASILDIGCSSGLLSDDLRRSGFRNLKGIDVSPLAIANCAKRGISAEVMDAGAPDLERGSYDLILASDVLEHIADDAAALAEWHSLLKPGGTLIAFVPAFMFLWSAHDDGAQHFRRYTLRELKSKLAAAQFRVAFASYWNFFLFWPSLLVKRRLSMPISPVNSSLAALLRIENAALRAGIPLPIGISAMTLARRPP